MKRSDSRSIGRAGGEDDEPPFPSVPAPDDSRAAEGNVPLGRSGGEDDEPAPSSSAPVEIATVPPDDVVSLPARPADSDEPHDGEASGNGWTAAAASLVFWGVVVWLAVQAAGLVRATLALPVVLRVPALAAEAAAIGVGVVWIVRIVDLFVGFRKRSDADWPAYYRRIGDAGTFVREFPAEGKERARRTVRDLAVRQIGMTKEWRKNADAFESEREDLADGIAKNHALLTAIKTATSPWKIVDVLAVFYNSTRMVERIARLYGQPCSGPQAFRLVCQWGFNLYVAGELGDVMEKGAEMTTEKAVELLQNTGGGISWLGTVLPMAGKIFAKAGEGATNYYLCRRLGRTAIDAFKPDLDNPPTRRGRGKLAIWTTAVLILLGAWFLVFGILAMVRS